MLVRLLMLAVFLSVSLATEMAETAPYAKFQLSESHLAATKRHRRIILNFDVISGDRRFGGRDPKELVQWKFHAIDQADVQIDSVWWCWGEGNQAPWASKTMVLYDAAGYRKWVRDGVDIVKVFFDAAKERGIESFFNFRINGSDNDLGPFRSLERKIQNPQWLIRVPWRGPVGLWNYGIPEVRAFRLEILREIAERYDHNGISLDFARSCPVALEKASSNASSGRPRASAMMGSSRRAIAKTFSCASATCCAFTIPWLASSLPAKSAAVCSSASSRAMYAPSAAPRFSCPPTLTLGGSEGRGTPGYLSATVWCSQRNCE